MCYLMTCCSHSCPSQPYRAHGTTSLIHVNLSIDYPHYYLSIHSAAHGTTSLIYVPYSFIPSVLPSATHSRCHTNHSHPLYRQSPQADAMYRQSPSSQLSPPPHEQSAAQVPHPCHASSLSCLALPIPGGFTVAQSAMHTHLRFIHRVIRVRLSCS